MTSLFRLFPSVLTNLRSGLTSALHGAQPEISGGVFTTSVRTVIRCHFPRPNERRRVLRHGWKQRMSTPAGRRILMNRILKGRFVYSH